MGHATSTAGVTWATLSAGPVFTWSMALAVLAGSPQPIAWGNTAWLLAGLLPPVIMVGAVLALIPNLLGSTLLVRAGNGNAALRLPVVWALAGGLAAGAGATTCSADQTMVAGLAATGTVSALLCRWGTHWAD